MHNSAVMVLVFATLVACADRGITEADRYTDRMLHVQGVITDCSDSSPLAGAAIRVYYTWETIEGRSELRFVDHETTLARTTTDQSGYYEASFSDRQACDANPLGAAAQEFTVEVSKSGYDTWGMGWYTTDGARCVEGLQRLDHCLRRIEEMH